MRRGRLHKRKKSLGNFFAIQKAAIMRKKTRGDNQIDFSNNSNDQEQETNLKVGRIIVILIILYIIFTCISALLKA